MKNIAYTFMLLLLFGTSMAQGTQKSVLSDGDVYKISISETGIYRLSYDFLSAAGLDLTNVNPRNIAIYGNGGGMLPSTVSEERIDDLAENAIQVVGEEDGRFDTGDYILFYAQGSDQKYYDENLEMLRVERNLYDTQNYYFLKIQNTAGKHISEQASLANTDYNTSSYNALAHLEDDKVNLLDAFISAQGSGSKWYGDQFKNISQHNYSFNFPNIIAGETVKLRAELVGRHPQNSRFSIQTSVGTFQSDDIRSSASSFGDPSEATYGQTGVLEADFPASTEQIDLSVIYTGHDGWLDYITLNARCELSLANTQLHFQDVQAWEHESTTYSVSNLNGGQIWDISNPLEPKFQANTNGRFGADATAKSFVAFTENQALTPNEISPLSNQNIHGIEAVEMIILFHEDFTEQAARLLEHRQDFSNLLVDTVRIDKLYNEFSSGRQDPTAIRDFARLMRQRNPEFKYLLLFGDGSFDYRDIRGVSAAHHFIPVYETSNSLSPILSYPTDDYYALLDDEGADLRGDLDIAVGRLPVKTALEAQQAVDKIIAYESAAESLGDWRNRLVFVADDEDRNLHLNQTDRLAERSKLDYEIFNQDKIYFDAFPQVSTAGGEGFPLATEALNQSVFKGALAINYLGHGGSKGWAQERVLDRDRGDIRGWTNFNRLPVFVTATCSFTGYDDPNQVTAGEEVFLNPNGGGIALFTTVRAVYSNSNEALVKAVFDTMFYLVDGERPTLGEIMRVAKNNVSVSNTSSIIPNTRKFTLIGDPATQLALPKYEVVTTKINRRDVKETSVDTLRALQQVVIEGEIRDENGLIFSPFNGEIFPTIYDKSVSYATLGQDSGSRVDSFELRNNTLFKGRVSVQNGKFQFTFVMPKDINFSFGEGRISYYAQDTSLMLDAAGVYKDVVIGGTNPDLLNDDDGPLVEVFMNTENFVSGGITGENPILLVKLTDDNGINVAGNSIGHDLEAILDDDTQNTYLLNEFYESELDDYTRGYVRFPLSDLEEGLHTIRVKAWDIANNSSEGSTEFLVVKSDEVVIEDLLAFPNPFSDYTCIGFEHNLGGQEVDMQVNIYSIDGRLVKTLEKRIFAQGFVAGADDCMRWDGQSESGQGLSNGLYVYQVQLTSSSDVTKTAKSEFKKLVLLK